jgi:colanic acid biosynthesis glycosyl transferase WcaI
MKLKIIILSLNNAPELTGTGKYTGEMVRWLSDQGHEIHLISAPPYYPAWTVQKPYTSYGYAKESFQNLTTYRCPLWVPTHPTGIKRILHLASFALSSLPVLFFNIFWRPDVILVVKPTFFCAPAGLLASKLCRAVSWLHIQDFEVDAAFDMGLLSGKRLSSLVRRVERWLLQCFDRVSTISDKMVDRLSTKGVNKSKSVYFPNWVDTKAIYPLQGQNAYRKELGLPEGKIVALYSGNMGNKQGLEILAEAAQILHDRSEIHFVFCGNGSGRETLVSTCHALPNVSFMDLQPFDRLNELLNLADIHLLPQRADAADLVMPSKLTGMLASGRPIVATASPDTEVANVVQNCGIIVPPGDARLLSNAIAGLAGNPQRRLNYGKKARIYAEENLSQEVILTSFVKALEDAVLSKKK